MAGSIKSMKNPDDPNRNNFKYIKVQKVNQSCYRPGVALRVPGR